MTIPTEMRPDLHQDHIDGYIELYDLNLSSIGGPSTPIRFTSYLYTNQVVRWGGNNYFPIPAQLKMPDTKVDSGLPQPKFVISNLTQFIMDDILSLGDIIGAELTLSATLSKHLDADTGGTEPSTSMLIRNETYYIKQLSKMNYKLIEYRLSTPMDRITHKIPRRQALRDGININGTTYAFPGLSNRGIRDR